MNNNLTKKEIDHSLNQLSVHDRANGFVIGAGSIGLIAASYMAPQLNSVTIFESSSKIGGVTKDLEYGHGNLFFAGCQYLQMDYLPSDYDYNNLQIFEHRYSSITDIDGFYLFKKDFAVPAFPDSWFEYKKINLRNDLNIATCSLKTRLSYYPPNIQSFLINLFSIVYPGESLDVFSSSSAEILGFGRVTAIHEEIALMRMKEQSIIMDQLYGVPRNRLGIEFETVAVPKLGYSNFWIDFLEQLRQRSQIILELGVKISNIPSVLDFRLESTGVNLWTGDPRFPVRNFTQSRLDSKTSKKYLTGISITSFTGPTVPYYINVFSLNSTITRVYIYQLYDELKISLESRVPYKNISEIEEEIMPLLSSAGITARFPQQVVQSHLVRQYLPITHRDTNLIHETEEIMCHSGWAQSRMYLYQRSSRLNYIKKTLAEL